MRTGMDIVQAAILGAEEFNFGTAALIATGCVYVRQCHFNTCPVGSPRRTRTCAPSSRARRRMIINFFNGVAEEVREILARLGVRTLNEIIGQTEIPARSAMSRIIRRPTRSTFAKC